MLDWVLLHATEETANVMGYFIIENKASKKLSFLTTHMKCSFTHACSSQLYIILKSESELLILASISSLYGCLQRQL